MTLMQVREMRLCPTHRTAVVQLDDVQRGLTMTLSADPHEAGRLARMMERGPQACHPVFDFVRALLDSFEAGVVRIVLDDVQGEGIEGPAALSHAEPAPPPAPGAISAWLDRVRPDDFETNS